MFLNGKLTARDKMEMAYFEMLETTHYSKIAVSDIIDKAGISRTTFYRHYDDIFDMHQKVADRLSDNIIKESLKRMFCGEGDAYDLIADVFITQDKYISLISGENGSRAFLDTLYLKTTEYFTPAFSHISQEDIFRFNFVVISAIAIYVRDIIENRGHDKREYDTQIIDICKKIINLERFAKETYGK